MARINRNNNIDHWLKPENIVRLRGWARSGLSYEQLANNMGINRNTLTKWRKESPQLETILKFERDVVDFQLENKIIELAMKGNPNLLMFCVCNRMPDRWSYHPLNTEQKKVPSAKVINYYAEDQAQSPPTTQEVSAND
jgi:transcriptional regulator with XRE-family HTH domain